MRRSQEAQDGVLGDELVAGGRLGSQTELALQLGRWGPQTGLDACGVVLRQPDRARELVLLPALVAAPAADPFRFALHC